jgi:hypothetical protein
MPDGSKESPESVRLRETAASMPHRRFLSSIFVDQHGKQASFYAEVAGRGVVLPKHGNAFKSWMLSGVPQSCDKQWAAADAPEGLGFTFAAPISDNDNAPPDGGASKKKQSTTTSVLAVG